MNWLEGNRKLVLAGLLGIMAGIGLIAKAIEWEQFLTFAQWVFGLYVGGNVGEHVATALKKKKEI